MSDISLTNNSITNAYIMKQDKTPDRTNDTPLKAVKTEQKNIDTLQLSQNNSPANAILGTALSALMPNGKDNAQNVAEKYPELKSLNGDSVDKSETKPAEVKVVKSSDEATTEANIGNSPATSGNIFNMADKVMTFFVAKEKEDEKDVDNDVTQTLGDTGEVSGDTSPNAAKTKGSEQHEAKAALEKQLNSNWGSIVRVVAQHKKDDSELQNTAEFLNKLLDGDTTAVNKLKALLGAGGSVEQTPSDDNTADNVNTDASESQPTASVSTGISTPLNSGGLTTTNPFAALNDTSKLNTGKSSFATLVLGNTPQDNSANPKSVAASFLSTRAS